MGKKIVAFYSWGGNTKAVAEYIAQKTGADLLELIPVTPYSDNYNQCVDEAGKGGRSYEPELKGAMPDLAGYDVVYAGSPCWWGSIANPLRTFLHQNDFAGKTVIPFMTHGTSGICIQDIPKLCPKANILEGLGIYNCYQVSTKVNDVSNLGDYRARVDVWLKNIGIG